MKLTKFEHACFILEEQGQKIIVDPGEYSNLPEDLANISLLVITHNHPDHFDLNNIQKIQAVNPAIKIFAPEEVVQEIPGSQTPHLGQVYDEGVFWLEFYGGLHEQTRADIPQITNLGVLINSDVAYPGDSYAEPEKKPKVLLAPANAPWLRMKEAFEFVERSTPQKVIPTHNFLLSEAGQSVYDAHFKNASEKIGADYIRLAPGQTIEI